MVYPEARAALAASARCGGRLTPTVYRRSIAELERLGAELVVIGVDEPLAEHAGELAAEFGLRGYDAVHLATASALGEDVAVLVTWDRVLGEAASRAGLAVAPDP